MPIGVDRPIDTLRRVVGGRGEWNEPDAQLVGEFALHGDEAAFEAIVERHGPLV
jgi:hypothetical protein